MNKLIYIISYVLNSFILCIYNFNTFIANMFTRSSRRRFGMQRNVMERVSILGLISNYNIIF